MEFKKEEFEGGCAWVSRAEVPGLSEPVEISMLVDSESGPLQEQVDEVKWVIQSFAELKDEITRGIFEWYKVWMENYKDGNFETFVDEIPLIGQADEVWEYLEEPSISFSETFGVTELILTFSSDWDSEYNVVVYFEGRKIDRVSNDVG